MFNIFAALIFGLICHASETFISLTDDLYAKQVGVKNIQFVMGGNKEQIIGEVDKEAIRRGFMSNINIHYECYSKTYGGESKKIGINSLKFDLDTSASTYDFKIGNVAPSNLKIESAGLDDPKFIDCIRKWDRIKMMAPPQGMTAKVFMPIEAKLQRPSNK